MKKILHTLTISSLVFINCFAGDFYTESTIVDDVGADYVIIQDNRIVDIIDKGLGYSVETPVANIPPGLYAGADRNICVGNSTTLVADASDVDGSITSYRWSEGGTNLSYNSSFVYTVTSPGNHDILLTVRDNVGVANTDRVNVYASTYPTVNAGVDKTIRLGETVNLSGTASDSDGSISNWLWKGPNGLLGNTSNISYKPTIIGSQSLSLTVTDNTGCQKTDYLTLNVIAEPCATTYLGSSSNSHTVSGPGIFVVSGMRTNSNSNPTLASASIDGSAVNWTTTFKGGDDWMYGTKTPHRVGIYAYFNIPSGTHNVQVSSNNASTHKYFVKNATGIRSSANLITTQSISISKGDALITAISGEKNRASPVQSSLMIQDYHTNNDTYAHKDGGTNGSNGYITTQPYSQGGYIIFKSNY